MYKQPGLADNEGFGEFEVDYVYLYKTNSSSLNYEAVPEEIADLKWITKEELPPFMEETINKGGYFSPWFVKMQSSGLLNNWWKLIETNTFKNELRENEHKVLHLI
jgi:isopentenyldiphosphate isomerase